MFKLISEKLAIRGLLIIFSLLLIFHFMIISGIIPFDIVWGGRLESRDQMIQFEMVSIVLNAIMLLIVAIKAEIIKLKISPKFLKISFWIMFGLFALNTVGNLFSNNQFEQIVFTPITLIMSLFCLRLAMSNTKRSIG